MRGERGMWCKRGYHLILADFSFPSGYWCIGYPFVHGLVVFRESYQD